MKHLGRATRVIIGTDGDDVIGATAMMIRKFLHLPPATKKTGQSPSSSLRRCTFRLLIGPFGNPQRTKFLLAAYRCEPESKTRVNQYHRCREQFILFLACRMPFEGSRFEGEVLASIPFSAANKFPAKVLFAFSPTLSVS